MLSLIPKMGKRTAGCAKRPLFPSESGNKLISNPQFGAWKDGFCGIEFFRHFRRQLIRTSIAEVMQVHG
jgi:hypothetical protein